MKRLLILAFITLGFTGFAQNDSKAETLLNEVSNKIKSYKNISIDFKYELNNVNEENMSQETRGDVVIEGEKYKLNILGVTRIFDGKTLYTISPEDEEVTISSDNSDASDSTIKTPSVVPATTKSKLAFFIWSIVGFKM